MKTFRHLIASILLCIAGTAVAQSTGIGTTNPDPSAVLEAYSINQGFLPPRLTEIQRDSIQNPASGLMIYNTDDNCLQVNVGTPQFPDWDCLARVAQPAEIAAFTNCADPATGSFTEGVSSGGVKILHYTGGNGGQYNISVISTGVNGLTASAQGTLNFGEGDITLSISGIPDNGGTASFAADINGVTCNFDVTVTPAGGGGPTPPPVLPGSIILTAGQEHIIASVLDSDYVPYAAPTGPATTAAQAADGTPDTTVDVQGTLTTTGVTVKIPYSVTGAATVLPAFTQTVTVTADKTQNGAAHDVTLSYDTQSISGTGFITATIKAVGSILGAKKLDINSGIGSDGKGVLLAEFTIATDGFGGTGKVQLRCLPGIPDRAFGDGAHNFLYMPIVSSTGKMWLNNNLGANYNKVGHASFNPTQQGISASDYNAYGSLYQWGRYSDGHELINWTSSTAGASVNTSTTSQATGDTPGHGNYITGVSSSPYDWRVPQNNALWQGENGTNNPCPEGFKVPTEKELTDEVTAYVINDSATAYSSVHKFVTAGERTFYLLGFYNQGTVVNHWTSTTSDSYSRYRAIHSSGTYMVSGSRATSISVRCIKE